ncbi:Pre-mRNA-splicing factor CWC22 [Carex littledalei]|uniref:Pre-mRNA-splicing factor CWC22 n=1 Tax=Carex littledalei TaxID=544730 RepID=A0A833VKV4_9POAL|nr:Pre-mRNA-splicing factor CWC22 [Carex littledalei]
MTPQCRIHSSRSSQKMVPRIHGLHQFTSIGFAGITESLREYLMNMPHLIMQQKPASELEDESGSSSDDSSGSNSSSGSESESENESEQKSKNSSDQTLYYVAI